MLKSVAMNKAEAWLRQPSTLVAAGLVLGAVVYWLTRDASIAAVAAAVIPGAMSDHTKDLLARVEAIEDAARPVVAQVKLP